jgi:hypothetical protein
MKCQGKISSIFEAFEGKLTVDQLEEKVDRDLIKKKAIALLDRSH